MAHFDIEAETLDAATAGPRGHSDLQFWKFWFLSYRCIDVQNVIKIGDGAVQHCPFWVDLMCTWPCKADQVLSLRRNKCEFHTNLARQ